MAVNLDDYVPVNVRIAELRAKHPEASLQPVNPAEPFRIIDVAGKTFLVYTAAAYRTPDDPRPGIGTAWEPVPGKTPYTRDSEAMVAETSAWGRAIVATLAADASRGIATREEVANRQESQERHPAANVRKLPDRRPAENSQIEQLANLVKNAKEAKTLDSLRTVWTEVGNMGLLQENLAKVGISPDMTFMELLYERSSELDPKKGRRNGR